MRFSVIIPTYNRRSLLEEALASVFAQELEDFEVIVVDDGSSDDTASFLDSISRDVHVFAQENGGPGSARNLGARQAQGDYLAFLDSDDVWFPWTLSTFSALIDEHRSPSLLAASVREFASQKIPAVPRERMCHAIFPDYLAASYTDHYVGAGMAVVKRVEFSRIGGFAELASNSEDHDFALRLGLSPGFVKVISPTTLGWRRHFHSATHDILRSARGSQYLIEQERRGAYPGGRRRRRDRQRAITRQVRPVVLACLRQRHLRQARLLYRRTFWWHVVLRRWKFLLGFPLMAVACQGFGGKPRPSSAH